MITIRDLIVPGKKGETKFIFFCGKGGVGKSTMSCATAIWLAQNGYKTLLVTTDPAPNLSDIFSQGIGRPVTPIRGVDDLSAIEIDPDAASRHTGKRSCAHEGASGRKSMKSVREQLNSPCVEEIAAFNKFIGFMGDPMYDVVIFDTAPTGHTIRLLELPGCWSEEI